MALHAANDLSFIHSPRFAFLFIPLVVITIFCFGYVSMQGRHAAQASASPSRQHAAKSRPSDIPRQLLQQQPYLQSVPVAASAPSAAPQQQPQTSAPAEAGLSQASTATATADQSADAGSQSPQVRDGSTPAVIAPLRMVEKLLML